MAFGSSGSAGKADLEFTATTGPAKTGIEELRRTFHSAIGGMSKDALELANAQDRLDTALVRSHGRVTSATRSAELNLRKLASTNTETAGAATAAGSAFARESRDIERLGRGALVGSGLVRGLGRAAAFSSSAFLGGAGLVYAIRTVVKAQQEHQASEAQLAATLRAQGITYTGYRAQIQETLRAQEQLTGFSEDDTVQAFTKLVRTTGDVASALKRTALAANIAHGANIPLATATNIVNKALADSLTGLRRLGIEIPKGATGYQGLEIASRKFAGASQANADTAAGAQARLTGAIHDTEVGIGQGLEPTVTRLSTSLTDWLDKSKNQQRIQDDVNRAVRDGTAIVHGLVDAERLIGPPIQVVIKLLGGLEHAVEVAFIAGVVLKARKAALSFGLIQAASTKTAAVIVADAAVEDAAIAGVGATAITAGSRIAGLGAGLAGLGRKLGPLAIILAATQERGGLTKGIFAGVPGYDKNGNKINPAAANAAGPGAFAGESEAWWVLAGGKPGTAPTTRNRGFFSSSLGLPGYLTPAQTRAQNLALHPNDLGALGAQVAADNSALAFLEKLRASGQITGAAYITKLKAITADRDSYQSQIDQINQAARSKAAAAALKAQRAADNARHQALKDIFTNAGPIEGSFAVSGDFARSLIGKQKIPSRASGSYQYQSFAIPIELQVAAARAATTSTLTDDQKAAKAIRDFARAAIKSRHLQGQALIDAFNAITSANSTIGQKVADVRGQNEAQFLSSAQNIIRSYDSNFGQVPALLKQTNTHLFNAVHESRQQTHAVRTLTTKTRFPGSWQGLEWVDGAAG